MTYISWLRRKSAFVNGANRPGDTTADAVKTHQLLRTSEDLERLFMGDIRIVAADNGLENRSAKISDCGRLLPDWKGRTVVSSGS
jgi:hypothetical protein